MTDRTLLDRLRADPALTAARAERIPDAVQLLPSAGMSAENAADHPAAGALAVCPGTDVVAPAAVEAGAWAEITERARTVAAALTARRER